MSENRKSIGELFIEGTNEITSDARFTDLLQEYNIVGINGLVLLGKPKKKFGMFGKLDVKITGIQECGTSLLSTEDFNEIYQTIYGSLHKAARFKKNAMTSPTAIGKTVAFNKETMKEILRWGNEEEEDEDDSAD